MSFAVIFDMDGVLIDSLAQIVQSHYESLPKFGLNLTKKEIEKDLHIPLRIKVKKWKEKYQIEFDTEEYVKSIRAIQNELLKNVKAAVELQGLLIELKRKNIKLAVATNSKKERANRVLTNIELIKYFDVITGFDDVVKHKPDPEMFLLTATRLQIKPVKCVVFEDAGTGILAAKNAGMKAIGIQTEYNSKEELRHADLIIEKFNEVNYDKLKQMVN